MLLKGVHILWYLKVFFPWVSLTHLRYGNNFARFVSYTLHLKTTKLSQFIACPVLFHMTPKMWKKMIYALAITVKTFSNTMRTNHYHISVEYLRLQLNCLYLNGKNEIFCFGSIKNYRNTTLSNKRNNQNSKSKRRSQLSICTSYLTQICRSTVVISLYHEVYVYISQTPLHFWKYLLIKTENIFFFFKLRVSERGFTSKQRKKVIYGREKHRKRRKMSRKIGK